MFFLLIVPFTRFFKECQNENNPPLEWLKVLIAISIFSIDFYLLPTVQEKTSSQGPPLLNSYNIYLQEQNIVTLLLCEQLQIPFKQWRSHLKQLISGSRRSPGGGHGNPLQYSCQENPIDRGAWQAMVHGITKSRTQLKWLSMHAWNFS